jgi:hypothetical protein
VVDDRVLTMHILPLDVTDATLSFLTKFAIGADLRRLDPSVNVTAVESVPSMIIVTMMP